MPNVSSITNLLPLADLSPAWRAYGVATYAAAAIVIFLTAVYVLSPLARESWDWIHDALRRPDVAREARDRARMNSVVSITERRERRVS